MIRALHITQSLALFSHHSEWLSLLFNLIIYVSEFLLQKKLQRIVCIKKESTKSNIFPSRAKSEGFAVKMMQTYPNVQFQNSLSPFISKKVKDCLLQWLNLKLSRKNIGMLNLNATRSLFLLWALSYIHLVRNFMTLLKSFLWKLNINNRCSVPSKESSPHFLCLP